MSFIQMYRVAQFQLLGEEKKQSKPLNSFSWKVDRVAQFQLLRDEKKQLEPLKFF